MIQKYNNHFAEIIIQRSKYNTAIVINLLIILLIIHHYKIGSQSLSADQKAQVKSNLGLAAVATSGSYNDLTDKPSDGTKLYRHHITFVDDDNNVDAIIISTQSTSYNDMPRDYISLKGTIEDSSDNSYFIITFESPEVYCGRFGVDGTIHEIDLYKPYTDFTDTVTEL